MYNDKLITKIHRLCHENEEYRETLQEIESHNQYIISQITHEIRNPLTLISSCIQLLEKHYPELSKDEIFKQLTEDTNSLSLLLDSITKYNHSSSLNYETISIPCLLNTLISSFNNHALSRNKKITLLLPQKHMEQLNNFYCDGVKMRQAFTNIMKNALEAMTDYNELIITLKYNIHNPELSSDTQTYLSISFRNNGEPLDLSELDHIFLPFITTKSRGSGMGLPTTREIIHAHGGFITCNVDTIWTEFKIYLPIKLSNQN